MLTFMLIQLPLCQTVTFGLSKSLKTDFSNGDAVKCSASNGIHSNDICGQRHLYYTGETIYPNLTVYMYIKPYYCLDERIYKITCMHLYPLL